MSEARRVQIPDGENGFALQWPMGSSQTFILRDRFGELIENVNVTPVWLESGEVRFFHETVLRPADEGRGSRSLP